MHMKVQSKSENLHRSVAVRNVLSRKGWGSAAFNNLVRTKYSGFTIFFYCLDYYPLSDWRNVLTVIFRW